MFEQRYPRLLEPLRLRGLTVRNRIMSAPNMLFQTIGGRTTEYYTRYLEAKARGGAGIVTLGEVPVCDGGCHTPGTVMSRENLAIFSEMSAAIREHGAVSSVELTHGGRNDTGRDALEWAKEVVALGAGEILLTSMDRDGTRQGFDLALTRAVSDAVSVPVIASGGVGTLEHLTEGVSEGGADAVLAASIFHFGEYSIAQAKELMRARGIEVRL